MLYNQEYNIRVFASNCAGNSTPKEPCLLSYPWLLVYLPMKIDSGAWGQQEDFSCHQSHHNHNPHPNKSRPHSSFSLLKILYFNARSILPKLDDLTALVDTHNPDIVCIVESWLNVDMIDMEIDIPYFVELIETDMVVVSLFTLRMHSSSPFSQSFHWPGAILTSTSCPPS